MKNIKTYLLVVTGLLVVALIMGVYVWFKLQTLQTHTVVPTGGVVETAAEEIVEEFNELLGEETVESEDVAEEEAVVVAEEPVPQDAIVIEQEQLTDSQQKTLDTIGLGDDAIVITPAMIACAEKALGVPRVEEIVQGATPGPLETLKLLSCLK